MRFSAKASVPSPSHRLHRLIADGDTAALAGYHPKLTTSGHVIFNLRLDAALSASLHPEGWYIELAEYEPRQGAPLTTYIFRMPEVLEDEKVGWRVEIRETSIRQPPYESYAVIADAHGLPVVPYYRKNNQIDYTRPHSTDLYFSGSRLSRVEWARVTATGKLAVGVLRVKVLSISLEGKLPVVREETVYFDEEPELADCDSPRLEALPEQWRNALQALRERIKCTSSDCRGHYYSNPMK